MVAQRRRNLTDDVISELIRAEDDGDRLTADELRMLAEVLLMAGTDTTRNQFAAASRDPAVYDDPDCLDITREGPATMLTFGGGIHYCLGAHLARAELAQALTAITRRMPNPHRSGPAP